MHPIISYGCHVNMWYTAINVLLSIQYIYPSRLPKSNIMDATALRAKEAEYRVYNLAMEYIKVARVTKI